MSQGHRVERMIKDWWVDKHLKDKSQVKLLLNIEKMLVVNILVDLMLRKHRDNLLLEKKLYLMRDLCLKNQEQNIMTI